MHDAHGPLLKEQSSRQPGATWHHVDEVYPTVNDWDRPSGSLLLAVYGVQSSAFSPSHHHPLSSILCPMPVLRECGGLFSWSLAWDSGELYQFESVCPHGI